MYKLPNGVCSSSRIKTDFQTKRIISGGEMTASMVRVYGILWSLGEREFLEYLHIVAYKDAKSSSQMKIKRRVEMLLAGNLIRFFKLDFFLLTFRKTWRGF